MGKLPLIFRYTLIHLQQRKFGPGKTWRIWGRHPAAKQSRAKQSERQRGQDRDPAFHGPRSHPEESLRQTCWRLVNRCLAPHPPLGNASVPRHQGSVVRERLCWKAPVELHTLAVHQRSCQGPAQKDAKGQPRGEDHSRRGPCSSLDQGKRPFCAKDSPGNILENNFWPSNLKFWKAQNFVGACVNLKLLLWIQWREVRLSR